jgi:hypothetical protein
VGLLELVLIVLLVLFLIGGGLGYSRRGDWGVAPSGIFGVLLIIVAIVLLFRWL